jgi:hypothetical protein
MGVMIRSLILPPIGLLFGVLLGLLLALRKEEAAARGPGGATSLGEAMRRVGNMARQRAYIVVVSDFRGPRDWRRSLLALGGRHHVVAVEVRDAREQELPKLGQLRLVDPETGRQLKVDTSSEALRVRFAAAAAAERREVAAELTSAGARHVVLPTHGDWLRELTGFLRHAGAQ